MPKELIHFKIAETTAARLAGTRFEPCLRHCPAGLLLGSVLHDVFFYAALPRALPMAKVGHRIHGAGGEDTYALLRLQARRAAAGPERNLPATLLIGLAAHLEADTVMHPMVWHLTGDYYAPTPKEKSLARQRHRALESLMDMVACPEMLGRPLYLVRNQVLSLGPALFDALPVDGLADMAGIAPARAASALSSALGLFGRLQGLFPRRGLARTLHAASPWLPNAAREIAALFYAPHWLAQAGLVEGAIRWADPLSGEPQESTLALLMERAADRAAALCRRLEPMVFDGAPGPLDGPGPSLDSGSPGSATTAMHHVAAHPIPKLPQQMR
jgi:hypothetical protein